ncbi:uncharacterized protein CXorf38 homolog [Scomber scombrus]|uniref:Uncharacterized protein CXorf38 homolog n=1 Tax=Scomber scombrus TaxID=13677 RepID=A0AAV1MZZ0_SCOSC|nr:uncharacterized protein CXorf38 homolog [Scomber scombrus]
MVHGQLEVRLNDREYKNWLKAGRCLLILKEGLHPFVNRQMRDFHRYLLNQDVLRQTPCKTSCRSRGNKLSQVCRACSVWQNVILRHHRQPDCTVNWDNCFPPSWRTDHWEVAKAFMPRGQVKVKGAHECDASALLNLINYCNYFHVDVKYVKEVIRYRNELMHSCDFRVTDDWMRRYRTSLTHLVQQFSNVPEMAATEQQINDMLAVDLSISASGCDQRDSALEFDSDSQPKISADIISQWEAELLQERLEELLHAAAAPADDDTETLDAEQLRTLGGFLQTNTDLAERFSSELQAINSLKAGK